MERGTGVQPVPVFRGNKFPGRCCPLYDYQGKYYLKHSNKTVTLNYANFTSCNVHFKLSLVWVIIFMLADIDECGERNGLCGGVCVNEETDHRCTCMAGTTLAQDGFNCGGRVLKGVHKLCYVFMHLSL